MTPAKPPEWTPAFGKSPIWSGRSRNGKRHKLSKERFLSVRLGPQHVAVNYPHPMPDALVLEFESDQWVLYFYLWAEKKIEGCYIPGSLEAGLAYAKEHFGVRPEEWIEDSSN